LERRLGQIDAIGNNSGIMPIVPMVALQVEQRDQMIDAKWSGDAN
jgi:NADP-dependent 3-hydroxy acid dehydrogenase YdfG